MSEHNEFNTTPTEPTAEPVVETQFSEQPAPLQPKTADYVNYYSNPDAEPPKKKNGGFTFLKVIAGLAAIAIVSVSSIELYKMFGNQEAGLSTETQNSLSDNATSLAEAETNQGGTSSAETNSAASWISMAAPENALSIPDIVDKAMPSVVGVSAVFEYTQEYSWGYFHYGDGQTYQTTGTGTGIIMSQDGYIITNAHCIYSSDDSTSKGYGKAVSVSVLLGDQTEYDAEIVGFDLETDLAVLKINANNLTPAEFGDSDALRVGELVVAIGNPLGFDLFGTTTCGIVSALNREVTINEKDMTLIQTDTSINSGNSGGPLLNGYGQVIGVNSAKISNTYSYGASVEGLAFAIPISDAKEIIEDLIDHGYVTGRPQLGIAGQDLSETDAERFNMPRGVYVYAVSENSAAEAAGLRQGDIITGIQDQEITTMDELNDIKNEYNAGDTIILDVYRAGEYLEISLTLQEVKQQVD